MSDIRTLESVQRLYTKAILQRNNIKFNGYEERLKILNMESLENRRLKFDLIIVFKIIHNLIHLSFDKFFYPISTQYNFRRHAFTLAKPPIAKDNVVLKSFKHRVINSWNSLPHNVVDSTSLEIFKSRLKKVTF